ncbi:MarR family winged helix-turn-helix transcriptional regulator [Pseudorhodoferax soli]|uniref:MarR family transcriptional regulator n=1 Tax=Pseudorhodoferax soli TaxID=545864 RepID=A0A368XZC7_9BURK|nr:MarR family transcriptional regulator [Pseudorhodoferax soli]RCW72398.1 MarR family transcriptional regulator [Pseudorhodoferax soli]
MESAGTGSLGVLLRLLHQQFAGAVDEALAEAGFDDLRSSHASVFTFVPPEGMPVSELTRRARLRKQSMTQTVEELERLGYVERKPSSTDRRVRLVFLTPRGAKIRPLAMAAGGRIEAQWAELVGVKHLDALKRGLALLLPQLQPPSDGTTAASVAAVTAPRRDDRKRDR